MSETRRAFMAAIAGTAWAVPCGWQTTGNLAPHKFSDPALNRIRFDVDGWLLCSFGGNIFLECRDSAGMLKSNVIVYFRHPNYDALRGVELTVEQLRSAAVQSGIRDLLKNRKILELWE